MSRPRGRSRGCTGSIRRAPCSSQQSEAAIAAGAFHNDVVAVANEHVLFAHEQAFEDKDGFYADLRRLLPEVEIVEVPASVVSLADAIRSYLFNAQLVTLPEGGMALILPERGARDAERSGPGWRRWSPATARSARLCLVDVRQSMANGGGPACLRLRVVADPATVDPRFLVDEAKLDRIADCIERALARADRSGRPRRSGACRADRGGARALLALLDLRNLGLSRTFSPRRRSVMPAKSAPSRKPPAPLCPPSAATRRRASSRAPRARWPNR